MNLSYAKSHPELFNRLLLIELLEERLDELNIQQAKEKGRANWLANSIRIEEINNLLMHKIFMVKI